MKRTIPFLFFLLGCGNILFGQTAIKEKIEIAYGFQNQDSIVRFRKTSDYDKEGRLTSKHNYLYHYTQPGLLIKEEKALFNASTKVLTENVTNYIQGKEPVEKKTETCYLNYTDNPKEDQYIWQRIYNKFGEIYREDTLSYNDQNQLLEIATYDYRGNTSLRRDYYSYNKKQQQSKWETYFCWTSIDIKSRVVERRRLERRIRYRYNRAGKLISSKGKYLKKRINQRIKYDKDGYPVEDKTIEKIKVRRLVKPIQPLPPPSKEEDQGAKKKKKPKTKLVTVSNMRIKRYDKGRLIEEAIYSGNKELKSVTKTYCAATEADHHKDSLPQKVSVYNDNKLTETFEYEYNNKHQLAKKTNIKYSTTGNPRYTIVTYYNDQGKPIKEEQLRQTKVLSTLSLKYNEQGNLIEQSLSMQNNKKLEKTTYIYKYY